MTEHLRKVELLSKVFQFLIMVVQITNFAVHRLGYNGK